jgi:hypothetical protein
VDCAHRSRSNDSDSHEICLKISARGLNHFI